MTLVYVEVGDADDGEIVGRDAERFFKFRIRENGVKIFDIETIGNDGDFFWLNADVFDIKIFDGFGVGEIFFDERFGDPFEDTRNEVFRMVVGSAKKGDD